MRFNLQEVLLISTSRKREVSEARGIIRHSTVNDLGYSASSEVSCALCINRENAARCSARGERAIGKHAGLETLPIKAAKNINVPSFARAQQKNMNKNIYLNQVRKILLDHLKGYRFQLFLFGSQTTQQAGRTSDIDVGILPMAPLPKGLLSEIREELEESHIPYPVDLVDLSRSNPEFLQHISQKGIRWND